MLYSLDAHMLYSLV